MSLLHLCLLCSCPRTYILPQFSMLVWIPIELVRERAEEAVAVARYVGRVQPHGPQLRIKLLLHLRRVLEAVGETRLAAARHTLAAAAGATAGRAAAPNGMRRASPASTHGCGTLGSDRLPTSWHAKWWWCSNAEKKKRAGRLVAAPRNQGARGSVS